MKPDITIYANGVPSSSPGLRGTRYPGKSSPHASQPQRGCVRIAVRHPALGGTALRFNIVATDSQGRPHCIRPTLGWRPERPWRSSPPQRIASSRALATERTEILIVLDGFLTGLGDLK